MNKYLKAAIHIPCAVAKISIKKIFHPKGFKGSVFCAISPLTEISLDYGGKLSFGKKIKMRDGAKVRVRKGACCKIGKNVLINSNNIITCHDSVVIGDNVQLSPGVLIYDHDHDFRAIGGIGDNEYKTAPIVIEDNVWVGANTVILKGVIIGEGSVIAAGSVITSNIPPNTVVYQKRETIQKNIEKRS